MQKTIVWFNKSYSSISQVVEGILAADTDKFFSIIVTHPSKNLKPQLDSATFYKEPQVKGDEYLQWALAFCSEHQVSVFFCGHQAEYLAGYREDFKKVGTNLVVAASPEIYAVLDDKESTYQFLEEHGLQEIVPDYRICTNKAEFEEAVLALQPHGTLCFKPTVSIYGLGFRILVEDSTRSSLDRLLSGDTTYISSKEMTLMMGAQKNYKPIMVMPYLDGNERSIDCVAENGQLITCVIRRKTSKGQVLEKNEHLAYLVSSLTSCFNLDNCFNIQFREKDGKYYLLEINPRLSGGVHHTFHSGTVMPYLALLLKAGLPFPFASTNRSNIHYQPVEKSVVIPSPDFSEQFTIQGGTLTVRPRHIHRSYTLNDLTSFATRRNPNRAFLFASKLTGKHIPATPSRMLKAYNDLAMHLQLKKNQQMLVIGMAETAIGLAHGVYEALLRQGHQGTFLHSTRYAIDAPKLLGFEESHCHASEHLLFAPLNTEGLNSAQTLVLIDDEISTGNTLLNLLAEYCERYPAVTDVVIGSLTSFISEERKQEIQAKFPSLSIQLKSLFEGDFSFVPNPEWEKPVMPSLTGNGQLKDELLVHNYGRRGLDSLMELDVSHMPVLQGRVLVLGTGEFLYPPLLLASQIEASGATCFFQSTTRSPVAVGDAIKHAYAFKDNYEDDIENYVYNVGDKQYDHVLVCYETTSASQHALPFEHKKVVFEGSKAVCV